MRLKFVPVTAAIGILLCSATAFAQEATPPSVSSLPAWTQWLLSFALVVAAVDGLLKSVAGLLGLASSFWPKLLPLAEALAKASTEVHAFAKKVGDLVPGSAVKMAAKRAAKFVPPLAALVFVGSLSSGCAGAKTPADYAGRFEQIAQGAVDVADGIFTDVILPNLSQADQVTAKADFEKAHVSYQDAVVLLNDGISAYEAGKSANWGALIADVQGAAMAIANVVDLWGGKSSGVQLPVRSSVVAATFAYRRAELASALTSAMRYH